MLTSHYPFFQKVENLNIFQWHYDQWLQNWHDPRTLKQNSSQSYLWLCWCPYKVQKVTAWNILCSFIIFLHKKATIGYFGLFFSLFRSFPVNLCHIYNILTSGTDGYQTWWPSSFMLVPATLSEMFVLLFIVCCCYLLSGAAWSAALCLQHYLRLPTWLVLKIY